MPDGIDASVCGSLREVSTDQVSANDSVGYWVDLVCAHLVQVQCSQVDSATPFSGRIVQRELPGLLVSQIHACPQRVVRTPEMISRASEEHILVNIQRSGRSLVRQAGREAFLDPGDMALYASDRAYELGFDGPFWQTVLIVPAQTLRALAPNIDALAATRLPSEHMASRLITQLAEALMALPDETPTTVAQAGCDGLLATLAAGAGALQGGPRANLAFGSRRPAGFEPRQALDVLDQGVMALDPGARLLFANKRAQALLKQESGFRNEDGRIVLRGRLRGGFEPLLARVAASGETESLALRDTEGGVTHGLTISRIAQDATPVPAHLRHTAALLVFISTPGRQRAVSVRQLMQMFALTPAEARLAHALARGASMEDHQQSEEIKSSTARSQLQSVLRKTGTHRQQDLVRILACLPSAR